MAPLHYATFFDVAPVLTTLLHHTKVGLRRLLKMKEDEGTYF